MNIGCIETPSRGSFFCGKHQNEDNKHGFRYRNGTTIYLELELIKCTTGKLKSENLIVYDAFVDQNDKLLFLVNYSDVETLPFWKSEKQILASKINDYIEQLKSFKDVSTSDSLCNSSKQFTLPCNKKTRTVGVFLACYNCGIIAGFREIYSHETLAQTAAFLLYLIDYSVTWPKVIYKII